MEGNNGIPEFLYWEQWGNRKTIPFKSHKMTEISLLLFEFCYKTTGMNEVTAREATKDETMQRTRRAG